MACLFKNVNFVAGTVIAVILGMPISAQAGFQWRPPIEAPASAPVMSAPSPTTEMAAPEAIMPPQDMMPVPRAPIISEPLMPKNTSAPSFESVRAQPRAQASATGLYIDPYPLRNNQDAGVVSYHNMAQALAEKSGGLNPVQLGGGMTTGVKSTSSRMAAASDASSMNSGKSSAAFSIDALTPMIGNEPAPLPGYGIGAVERDDSMRQFAQAVGFGSDLPLALAISQVVPSEFTHRFDGNIDTAKNVTWEGGKPWNLVLNDMLRPQNLTADVQGNVVVIKEMARL